MASARTQNQLHIHIDCLAPDVVRTLREVGPSIGKEWKPLPVRLRGHVYSAMRIDDADLKHADPFKLIAPYAQRRGQTMGDQTLLLAGAIRQDGKAASRQHTYALTCAVKAIVVRLAAGDSRE